MPRRSGFAVAIAAALAAAIVPGVAAAAPSDSRLVVATKRDGVRLVGDLRVGPLGSSDAVSTLADVRAAWGQETRLRDCTASWGNGLRLLFTTFGGPSPCRKRFLQVVTITGPAWTVRIRGTDYPIGMDGDDLPTSAKYIAGWNGGGYEIATTPLGDTPTTSVLAHVNRAGRVDRFVLWIGGAGD